MDPITLGLIMGGIGGLKGMTIDKAKEKKDAKLAAITQELSPWTGLKANPVKAADPFGSAMKYGATGLDMGRQMNYDKAMMSALNNGDYASVLKSDGGWSGLNTGNGGTPVFGMQLVQPFTQEQIYGG